MNEFICLELDGGRLVCGRVKSSEVDITVEVRGFPKVRADAYPGIDVRGVAEEMMRGVDDMMQRDLQGRERLLAEAEAKVLEWAPPKPTPAPAQSYAQPPLWWNTRTMGNYEMPPGTV